MLSNCSFTWGTRMSATRKICCGMVYACSAWSDSRGNGTSYMGRTLQTVRGLQARGARAICGEMWSRKEVEKSRHTSWHQEKNRKATFRHTLHHRKEGTSAARRSDKEAKPYSGAAEDREDRTRTQGLDFRRKVPDISGPMCVCREGRETVRHVLLTCRELRDLWQQELST